MEREEMKLLSLLLAPVSRIHSYLSHIQVSQPPQGVQFVELQLHKMWHCRSTLNLKFKEAEARKATAAKVTITSKKHDKMNQSRR